jgi:hypothetical protein
MKPRDEKFLRAVAQRLRQALYVYGEGYDRRIFLCGANPRSGKGVRNSLGRALATSKGRRWSATSKAMQWSERYVVYYPEEFFDGLMSGPHRYDLLTLENILAEAVDAVVLVVESPGAIAELGAFANHPSLRKKLIVIQDEKYRHAKSFIGHGPVRLLMDQGEGKVLFLPLDDIQAHAVTVRRAVAAIAKAHPSRFDLSNVFHTPSLIIPCLFLLERLTREEIAVMVAEATGLTASRLAVIVSGAISLLLTERVITKERNAFRLADAAAKDFARRGRWSETVIYNTDLLDRIRIGVLTRQRRHLRPWAVDG